VSRKTAPRAGRGSGLGGLPGGTAYPEPQPLTRIALIARVDPRIVDARNWAPLAPAKDCRRGGSRRQNRVGCGGFARESLGGFGGLCESFVVLLWFSCGFAVVSAFAVLTGSNFATYDAPAPLASNLAHHSPSVSSSRRTHASATGLCGRPAGGTLRASGSGPSIVAIRRSAIRARCGGGRQPEQ